MWNLSQVKTAARLIKANSHFWLPSCLNTNLRSMLVSFFYSPPQLNLYQNVSEHVLCNDVCNIKAKH